MNKSNMINQQLILNKNNLRLLFPDIKEGSYNQNIKNWLKSGRLIGLKRGVYLPGAYWEKCSDKTGYINFLSSVLYSPSYVSKETMLFRYGILSESVYGLSAVTLKVSRRFTSALGVFVYSSIKRQLFTGFIPQKYTGNTYYVATKSKALFDYLYFYKRRLVRIDENSLTELRLNLEVLSPDDWQEFQKYLAIAKSHKLELIYKKIRKMYAGTN